MMPMGKRTGWVEARIIKGGLSGIEGFLGLLATGSVLMEKIS
jgi:hypothetical protein